MPESTFAKKDLILLPLVSLCTLLALLAVAEILSRVSYPEQETNACAISGQGSEGYTFKANCTATTKNAEGPWVTYRFNDCGYRSDTSCQPVQPGTLRIAVLGSSVSQGLNVRYEDTYFAISAGELRQACQRPIDVQNLGKPATSPIFAYQHVDEALKLKPDVVLFLLAPFDLEQQIDPEALANRNSPDHPLTHNAVVVPLSPMRRLQSLVMSSRAVLVAEHFLLQNRETFLRIYLNYKDKADFLRQPFTPAWQKRFADMDLIIGDMATKIAAAGVPFIVIPVPSRAEAALLSSKQWPPGVDPTAFGRTLEKIATDHGASYVDLMRPFAEHPNSQELFLVVDGHVAASGQRVIAENLTKKLLDGSVPAMARCSPTGNRTGL